MNERLKYIGRCALPFLVAAGAVACEGTPTRMVFEPTRTPKPTFTPTSENTPDDEFGFTVTLTPSMTPVPAQRPEHTPTNISPEPSSTPVVTPTTDKELPSVTPTVTVVVRPTEVIVFTPTRQRQPAPTKVPEPTEAPQPALPFTFVPERMKVAPNCGSVWLHGGVYDEQGNPINGQTVRLEFWGNQVFRKTGEDGEDPGRFGFAPLSESQFKSPQPFKITLVANPEAQQALSEVVLIDFFNCENAGQFDDITFLRK